MRRKYKLTGCARFLIFLLIAGPIIFFAAQYITGTSPWEEFKNLFNGDTVKTEAPVVAPQGAEADTLHLDTASTEEPVKESPSEAEQPIPEVESEWVQRIEELEKRIERLEKLLESEE